LSEQGEFRKPICISHVFSAMKFIPFILQVLVLTMVLEDQNTKSVNNQSI